MAVVKPLSLWDFATEGLKNQCNNGCTERRTLTVHTSAGELLGWDAQNILNHISEIGTVFCFPQSGE